MSDWEKRRIDHMEAALRDFCEEEKNRGTSGLLVFGSLSTKRISPDSDIDILAIAQSNEPRTRTMFEGEIIDKVTFTAAAMKDFVSNGFSLDWLIQGAILYDPHGELAKLKVEAEEFVWSESQIMENEKLARQYLATAAKHLELDLQSSLYLLHKASEEHIRSLAKRNGVKTNVDMGDFFRVVRDKEKAFYDFFKEVQGLGDQSRHELESWFHKLEYKKWDRLDWNVKQILEESQEKKLDIEEIKNELFPLWRKVPISDLHSAGDCLREGDFECALLYLREASFWYANVEKKNYETILMKLKQSDPGYHPLFLEINGLSRVDERQLRRDISVMNELLPNESAS